MKQRHDSRDRVAGSAGRLAAFTAALPVGEVTRPCATLAVVAYRLPPSRLPSPVLGVAAGMADQHVGGEAEEEPVVEDAG